MQIYDTRTAALTTISEGVPVTIYVCGITPYDVGHLGHALVAVTYDTLHRYLEFRGHTVTHVQNVTDIDDDVIRKAAEVHQTTTEVVDEHVAIYDREMRAINVRPPTYYPFATREIPFMLAMIQKLVADGNAYAVDGHVFFRAASFPNFGQLSKRQGDALISDTEPERLHALKRDRRDFTLWQRSLPGEPSWPSVWGEGRPGWHIECSAMALRYLGDHVTVHGGGGDLVFPHHESEIAQSEAFLGHGPVVQAWAHVGMLRIDGEKMSKSLKNMVFVSQLIERFSGDGIRLYLLSTKYRASLVYDEQGVVRADALARRIARAAALTPGGAGDDLDAGGYTERFFRAMDDDLDTPAVVTLLEEMVGAIETAVAQDRDASALQRALYEFGGVLGLTMGER
jgi:L-cysteine:1D-myo-inositol 2-amino-2-deoxy-alpha-D-glucopyranoside ligase